MKKLDIEKLQKAKLIREKIKEQLESSNAQKKEWAAKLLFDNSKKLELGEQQVKKLQDVKDSIDSLFSLLNGKEEYDFDKLHTQLQEIDKRLDLAPYFLSLEKSINNLKSTSKPSVTRETKIEGFSRLLKAIETNKPLPTKINLTKLEKAITEVRKAIEKQSEPADKGAESYTPVRRVIKIGNRFIFDDNVAASGGGGGGSSGTTQIVDAGGDAVTVTGGKLDVNASVDTTGLATSTIQTDGTQKSQIVDSGGEAATVTGGKLDVNATASLAGEAIPISGATEAVGVAIVDGSGDQITSFGGGTQYTEGDTDATITGTAALWEEVANTLSTVSSAKPLPVDLGANNDVTVTGTVTEANSAAIKTAVETIDNAISGSEMQVDVVTSALPSGAATSANQQTDALTDSELRATAVEVDTGLSQPIEDGGNVVVTSAPTTAVTGTFWQATQPVSIATNEPTVQTGTNAIGRVGHDITGIGHGVKTVTTAGTDEALAGSTACKRVSIQAQTDNTGWIAVGATGVDATVATGTGVLLGAGDVFELEIDNLADIYIDSTVNGDGVRYTVFT